MALHSKVAVCSNVGEHLGLGEVCGAVGYPGGDDSLLVLFISYIFRYFDKMSKYL